MHQGRRTRCSLLLSLFLPRASPITLLSAQRTRRQQQSHEPSLPYLKSEADAGGEGGGGGQFLNTFAGIVLPPSEVRTDAQGTSECVNVIPWPYTLAALLIFPTVRLFPWPSLIPEIGHYLSEKHAFWRGWDLGGRAEERPTTLPSLIGPPSAPARRPSTAFTTPLSGLFKSKRLCRP